MLFIESELANPKMWISSLKALIDKSLREKNNSCFWKRVKLRAMPGYRSPQSQWVPLEVGCFSILEFQSAKNKSQRHVISLISVDWIMWYVSFCVCVVKGQRHNSFVLDCCKHWELGICSCNFKKLWQQKQALWFCQNLSPTLAEGLVIMAQSGQLTWGFCLVIVQTIYMVKTLQMVTTSHWPHTGRKCGREI